MNELEAKKQAIREELDQLKYQFNVELPQKIAEAREHGDLKENADYHAARERQGFVNEKIAQLTEQLAKLSNVDVDAIPKDRVGLGSKVHIEEASGMKMEFTFVTDAETNPGEGKISLSTPFGRALNGKCAGDEVEVVLPVGAKKFVLKKLVTVHGNEFSV